MEKSSKIQLKPFITFAVRLQKEDTIEGSV